ncbi:MAG: VanZ family protein [Vicinamibacterales bacterium]
MAVTALALVLLLAALVAAFLRIRERRLARYGAIVAAVALAGIYSTINAGELPESNAVERFHFIEYGLITFLFYRAWLPLADGAVVVLPLLAGLIVGTAEEWLQWFIPNRVGELRDIFLNAAAIVCGLLFSAGLEPVPSFRARLGAPSARRVLRMSAATVIALGIFMHAVTLGYDINDDETGSFTSRYSQEQLSRLQQTKAEQWKTDPPPMTLRRLSREDQYLSEGLAHVRWRNRKWDAGDARAAWSENRILERYFAPVLDTPTYEGKAGHRWPPAQREDALARVGEGRAADAYLSDAYPYRLVIWSKPVFWSAIGLIAGLLLVLSAPGWRLRAAPGSGS